MVIKHLQLALGALVLVECSPPAPERDAAAATNDPHVSSMVSPVAAPAAIDDILGVIPGPCGSQKAADFMGRVYSPEVESTLKARTGASSVVIMAPDSPGSTPAEETRLSVLLNSRDQIIHLVCG